jgi:hypothetical protein
MPKPDERSAYQVGDPYASRAPEPRVTPAVAESVPQKPLAIFAAHGMGQQVPFSTMDDFARGICGAAERDETELVSRTATTLRVGCTQVQRIELQFENKPPLHIYEGYWAPLTEGVVGLKDVLRFLIGGAIHRIRSPDRLHRWLFGKPRVFPIRSAHRVALWSTLIVILAILGIGATILTVGIARLTFDGHVTKDLVRHLTGVFETLVATLIVAAAIAAPMIWLIRSGGGSKKSWILWIPAVLAGLAFVFGAAVVFLEMLRDLPPPFPAVCDHPPADWCFDIFVRYVKPRLEKLDDVFCWIEGSLRTLLVGATILAMIGLAIWTLVQRREDYDDSRQRATGGRLVTLALLLLTALFFFFTGCSKEAIALITWLSLLGFTVFLRKFVIQYVGDVAAYVSPHVVDRFFDLRYRVKDAVWKAAKAVYALRDDAGNAAYDRVFVAGHSLGSVIVYDVLNRLINEDKLNENKKSVPCCDGSLNEPLDVSGRTRFLLTYGSPLDKTAFIFSMQDSAAGSERDAIAATLQPLIVHERQFEWRNIWSPYDIISGPIDFYDTPKGDTLPNTNRVINQVDPDANILLAAHTQYGSGPLLFDTLYAKLWS